VSRIVLLVVGAVGLFGIAGPARADPCEAPLPTRAGVHFSGAVRYVGDGDSLCVGKTTEPNEWIEVRLADFDAPELHQASGAHAKAALERVAFHREVTCTTERGRSGRVVSFDRVIARCRLGSQGIGDLLRRAGATEGGN
jgi:endonuclease YncB( thermonuclease family)